MANKPSRKDGARVFNFCSGPATLPLPVLEEAQRDLLSLPGQGVSVLEISHRSSTYADIQKEAETNLRFLLAIPDDYAVAFLAGGASLQFSMVAMNFLPPGRIADYIVTGTWGKKAVSEARKHGRARVIWDGAANNHSTVPLPGDYTVDPSAPYLHFTSNETIQGVELVGEPESPGVPLICDASSNLLSRPMDIRKYALVYAGAQKNLGPAGVTLVIVKRELLERIPQGLPSMLDYRAQVEADSTLNTPPVFAVYLLALTTRWVRETFGDLEMVARHNQRKAALLYAAIDESGGFYQGHAREDCRSWMNATWRLPNEGLERLFLSEAETAGLVQLAGHRSVGGVRASIYNAMSLEGVEALVAFMRDFRSRYAE